MVLLLVKSVDIFKAIECIKEVNDPAKLIKNGWGEISIAKDLLDDMIEATDLAIYFNPKIDEKRFLVTLIESHAKAQAQQNLME